MMIYVGWSAGLLECNTLCSQEILYCIVVLSQSLSRVFCCPRFSLPILTSAAVFYNTRPLWLHCESGFDRWSRVVGPLYRRGLLVMNSQWCCWRLNERHAMSFCHATLICGMASEWLIAQHATPIRGMASEWLIAQHCSSFVAQHRRDTLHCCIFIVCDQQACTVLSLSYCVNVLYVFNATHIVTSPFLKRTFSRNQDQYGMSLLN
jgi:hypothetical protein